MRRPASSPCFIAGARISSIIPTCTALSPAAGSRRTAADGSRADPGSSCPSGSWPSCFAVCSWNVCGTPSIPENDTGKLKFFHALEPLRERRLFLRHLAPARKAAWVVYAKPPFGGAEQVLAYVARYTHRVAIANDRLLDIADSKVRFRWKDYRDGNQPKTMTLTGAEFIRRFLLHVLPNGFQRIRYYGFLGNRYRAQKLARCRALLAMIAPEPAAGPPAANTATDERDQAEGLIGASLQECPICHHGRMIRIDVFQPARRRPTIPDTS